MLHLYTSNVKVSFGKVSALMIIKNGKYKQKLYSTLTAPSMASMSSYLTYVILVQFKKTQDVVQCLPIDVTTNTIVVVSSIRSVIG